MKSSKAEMKAISGAQAAIADWLKQILKPGERYAGVVLGADGMPSHHLILVPGEAEGKWPAMVDWAKIHGEGLPTRQEQALLYANLKGEFQPRWYWSSTQHAYYSDCAWLQHFGDGNQGSNGKSASGRARAVRRLVIL